MQDSFSKFTVIMTVYNSLSFSIAARSINSCFDNVLYNPGEVIVIGDGVDKWDFSMVEKNNRDKIVFKSIKKSGLAYALNIAVSIAKFNIIARMDGDDICINSRFDKQIPYFLKGKYDLLGANILKRDLSNKEKDKRSKMFKSEKLLRRILWTSPFNHPTVIFKKNHFIKVGEYNHNYQRRQDLDLWYRYQKGAKIGNMSDVVLTYSYNSLDNRTFSSVINQIKIGSKAAFENGFFTHVPLGFLLLLKWFFINLISNIKK
jgi:glycosyltransferase involved in cell wall biosynthesis